MEDAIYRFQKWLSDHHEDKIAPEILQHFGHLPGEKNGPGDAAGHISRAATLYLEHPGQLTSDWKVDMYLQGFERASQLGSIVRLPGSDSKMDLYNDPIGKPIGIYVRDRHGTREDVYQLVDELVTKSLGVAPYNQEGWLPQENGTLLRSTDPITLRPGLTVPPAAVMPKEQWYDNYSRRHLKQGRAEPGSEHELGCLAANVNLHCSKESSLNR